MMDALRGIFGWRSNVTPEPPKPTLFFGSSGEGVRSLQLALNRRGERLIVDGQFGPATRLAVIRFQRANGLAADGVVGPETYKALSIGAPVVVPSLDTPWMDVGRGVIGQIEVPGPGDNPLIVEMLKTTGVPPSMYRDSTAWCGAFVSWVLLKSGQQSIRNAWAASWMNYGAPTTAKFGAVAARQGHVGFVVDTRPGGVKLLGGNQSNAVNEQWYDDKGWAYRWPVRA